MSTSNEISLASLTPEQLASLKKQMAAARKERSGDKKSWNAKVDAMLQEKDPSGDGFLHTTAQILSALQGAKIVSANLSKADIASEIKRIQTRKQLLEKKRDDNGKLLFDVGYKPSANGFMISLDRVIAWAKTASRTELATLHSVISPIVAETPKPAKGKGKPATPAV